jgi:carboxymethylenebutenolidase
MNKKIKKLFDEYKSGQFDRRDFIKKSTVIAGGSAVALSFLSPFSSQAQIIAPDDPRLDTSMITYKGETGDVLAYMAKLKGNIKRPAVIVIHENRALQPHIKDVTRRMALEGFLAIAPDALSPFGGTPVVPEEAGPLFAKIDSEATKKNFVAAVQYLKTNPMSTGKVGCTGFCWGGSMTNQVAVNSPELVAAVPYYGGQPVAEDVPKIKAAMLLHYAGNDERINAGIPAYEEALKKAGIEYTIYMYEGAGHGFNNDTGGERYNKAAADLAWQRTIAFFKAKLGTT